MVRLHLVHHPGKYSLVPQVALERVREYSELQREPPEFIEPRPAPSWPEKGEIVCEDLVIRYAVSILHAPLRFLFLSLFSSHKPDLPDVLHHINFSVNPGEKVRRLLPTSLTSTDSNRRSVSWEERVQGRAR